jgi:hypothetical protein
LDDAMVTCLWKARVPTFNFCPGKKVKSGIDKSTIISIKYIVCIEILIKMLGT